MSWLLELRSWRGIARSLVLVAGLLAWEWSCAPCAANPWVPIVNPVTPDVGNTVPPPKLVPGTKMYFRLTKPEDRADVIEYLKERAR